MSNFPDIEEPTGQPERQLPPVDVSRRKLGLGLGASAVFTLASRPVLAGTCMTASSAASGNLSTHGITPTCSGRTPAEWVAFAVQAASMRNGDPNDTDNGYPGGNVGFHDVFASGGSADWGTERLYVVMGGAASRPGRRSGVLGSPSGGNAATMFSRAAGPNPISAEFAATLLNINDGLIPSTVLDAMKLIGMWNEWLTKGTFSPMAGATWNTGQIVAYLQSLQGSSL